MRDMNEELLQFIWKKRLLTPGPYLSASGQVLEIVDPGEQNAGSGPDFSNSRVRINGALLIGNVELHLRSSDWLKHHHQEDAAYDRIILHAVLEHDCEIPQNEKHNVEVMELKDLISPKTLKTYEDLRVPAAKLPCAAHLDKIPSQVFQSWLEKMSHERMVFKVHSVERIYAQHHGDYLSTFYLLFLRSLGLHSNAQPFEQLARHLPLSLLLKHADSLLQLEALLLGTAGFMDQQVEDGYLLNLQNEFSFLEKKYGLLSLPRHLFKFGGLRPSNFPSLRLAQLAALIHKDPLLFSAPQRLRDHSQVMASLDITLSGYWKYHYSLKEAPAKGSASFGASCKEILLINAFVPFYFFYGQQLSKPAYIQTALEILKKCIPENNAKTRLFGVKRQECKNAASSQALLHLHAAYCSKMKCLQCGLGISILQNRNETATFAG